MLFVKTYLIIRQLGKLYSHSIFITLTILCFSCDEMSCPSPTPAGPQFKSNSFQYWPDDYWIEFQDTGYPTNRWIFTQPSTLINTTGKSSVLMQDCFPPGSYTVAIHGDGNGTMTMYTKLGKRRLVELGQQFITDRDVVVFRFFITEKSNSLGFQADGTIRVKSIEVTHYISMY